MLAILWQGRRGTDYPDWKSVFDTLCHCLDIIHPYWILRLDFEENPPQQNPAIKPSYHGKERTGEWEAIILMDVEFGGGKARGGMEMVR